MASRYSSNQRVSRHSEHDDRFESRNSRKNERSSRRFDEYAKNRDITSTYDEESSKYQKPSIINDKGTSKFQERRQKYSKNDDELQENLENKIKFQESFGIDRRSSKKFDQENLKNTKKVDEDSQISGSSETLKVGQFKDLRQLLQSKRQQIQDEKAENEKKSSLSSRLGPKIKEEFNDNSQIEKKHFDDKPAKSGRNPSRFSENSARLVNNLMNNGRRPARVDDKLTKSEEASSKIDKDSSKLVKTSSKVDQTSTTTPSLETSQNSSEAPQPRIRKPIRIRNPANRLADLVRNQVVDAVKRNEKRENSASSKSEKSASNESLIEILSSSDDTKVVEVKSLGESSQKELDTAMERLKTDFDDISSSGSENWVDIIEEEESAKSKPKVDLRTKITAALRQGNGKITNQVTAQVDKSTNNYVQFKEPSRPEPKNLQRSSSMSSLAENKPQIQRNQSRVEPQRSHQQRPQFESRQPNRHTNQLQRTHSGRFHEPQPRTMHRNNFEAPQTIRPDISNSKEFQQFRFGPIHDYSIYREDGTFSTLPPKQFEHRFMLKGSNQFQGQADNIQNQPGWYDSTNWRPNYENLTSNSYQNQDSTDEPQKISVIISDYPQDHQSTVNYQELTSNYQEVQNLTSNNQETQHSTSNTQNIQVITSNLSQIPDLYKFPPPSIHPSQFQPQNQFINSNVHQYSKQWTPSPAPSSSSSSSSSATDLFGAPSKLEARLKKIQGNEKKFSDGNKSSSLESLKSNGFNANAQVFYPKQTDASFVPYQQQVEIIEPVYYDSHHSFALSAYVDESSDDEEVEPSNKLTHEQMINLLYVTKTSEKYMNEALSYYVEYYDELGYNLSKNAVDEVLTAKGIESKACGFNYAL